MMDSMLILQLLLSLFLNNGQQELPSFDPTVSIRNGTLRGKILMSEDGREYASFRGIPYAKPPSGHLRFKPPEPPEAWNGILDATKDGNECPQMAFFSPGMKGNENCLSANVYTPKDFAGKQFPVLLFIHGGGFSMGTGNSYVYDPQKFMNLDVVLVSINYRLGVLGFLSTNDENCPGNYGMLDQVQALHWVQENIENFGGNPSSVTVFGVSAGGAAVVFLVISPLTKGLFHAAVAQSGTTESPWALERNPLSWAKKTAWHLNCTSNDTKALVDCLRNATVEDIIMKGDTDYIAVGFPIHFTPVVEPSVGGGGGFIREDPSVLLRDGRIGNKVPFITGVVKDEGILAAQLLMKGFKTTGQEFFESEFPDIYLPHLLPVEPGKMEIAEAILKEYSGDREVNDPDVFLEIISEFFADIMFLVSADETLKLMASAGLPTYAYRYTEPSQTESKDTMALLGPTTGKVIHGQETHAQFKVNFFPDIDAMVAEETTDEIHMNKMMTNIWKNFAELRKPSFAGTTDHDLKWLSYNPMKPSYMEINKYPAMRDGLLSNRTHFWTVTIPRLLNKDT